MAGFDKSTATDISARGFDSSTAQPIESIEGSGYGILGAIDTVGGQGIAKVASGYVGMLGAALPGEAGQGAEWQKKTEDYVNKMFASDDPQTKALLQSISNKFQQVASTPQGQFVGENIIKPVSQGVSAFNQELGDLGMEGQGAFMPYLAEKTGIEGFRDVRLPEQVTGPLLGTALSMLPQAGAEIAGGGVVGAGAKQTAKGVAAIGKAGLEEAKLAATAAEKVTPIFQRQSATKQKIAELIEAGSDADITAKWKIKEPSKELPSPLTKFQQMTAQGKATIEKDHLAIETIKQGFDEGVIAPVKMAGKTAKSHMSKQVAIAERSLANKKYGMLNRPSDVAGDLLMDRVRIIRKANRESGARIGKIVEGLKSEKVNVGGIGDTFLAAMKDKGITIGKDGKLDFKSDLSDFEYNATAQTALVAAYTRMKDLSRKAGGPSAGDVHSLKKLLDDRLSFGNGGPDGMSGVSERMLKDLRTDINRTLGDAFPEYKSANADYSETITLFDELQSIAGRQIDLSKPNADKAVGTLMRRLMGNAPSRVRLLDVVNDIESAAAKHLTGPKRIGEAPDDDLLLQVLFADEMDSVFGPAARTSLQGDFDKTIKSAARATTSPREGVIGLGIQGYEKTKDYVQNVNNAGAIKAIKELLQEAD